MSGGFLKLMRSEQTAELLKCPTAFALASIIAYRARRNDCFNTHNLSVGEALLGDYRKYGMSEREYRTAKEKLRKWKIATFQATNKGTIGKLLDESIYDINADDGDGRRDRQETDGATDKRQASDRPETTNKNIRTKERKKKPPISPPGGAAISQELLEQFEEARTLYPGDKRGLDTEFENLKRKHRDWREIVPALLPSLDLQIARREKMRAAGEFVPNWKHFKTYINERCWEAKSG